jgi:hypothetical protein
MEPSTRFGNLQSVENPAGVTVDVSGVYVLLIRGPSSELVSRKYDARGNPVWTRPLDMLVASSGTGTASDATAASGVAVNADGAYVAGREGRWPACCQGRRGILLSRPSPNHIGPQ